MSVGSPGVHKVLSEPSECVWWVWGLILNTVLPFLPSSGASPLPLDEAYLFLVGFNILLLMVECLSVSCRGMCQKWSAAGAGALGAADLGVA